ncbi:MAG: hypothetical protein Q7S32_01370 [bacterium]|nr:hypothetical protein [bacterium]
MHNGCKCWHHWVPRVVAMLGWVSAVLFFWSSLGKVPLFGYDALYYAWVTVILMLLSLSKGGGCPCRGRIKTEGGASTNTCSHEMTCKCGDCGRCK